MKKRFVPAVLALGIVLAGTTPAVMADDKVCPPSLGAITVNGNVVVVAEGCRLDGTTVKGNVKVMPGGGLMTFGAWIFGNVQAEPENHYIRLDCRTVGLFGTPAEFADCVNLAPTRVGGNVQVKGTVSVPPMTPLNTPCEGPAGTPGFVNDNLSCKTQVRGDVQLEENRARFETNINKVRGNMQVYKNVGGQEILNNVIGGNLQCFENDPDPTGGGNAVAGDKQGECAGL